MEKIVTITYRCERCGKVFKGCDAEEEQAKHKCNPRLYDLILSIETKQKSDGVIICNNGAVEDVFHYLGISEDLANRILHEMKDLGLAKHAWGWPGRNA